jgi:hypothetical protein
MQGVSGMVLSWASWIAALVAIAAYVVALLRNRPYFRPFNALGLLLTGAALLILPKVLGAVRPGVEPYVVTLVCLLVAAAVLQTVSALRRRRRRADDGTAERATGTV